jgi:23S rRNA (adenine2030-N6)-methyltransferase
MRRWWSLDTHAGAGLYRLDGDYAETSGEAAMALSACKARPAWPRPCRTMWTWWPASTPKAAMKVYPGSPFIAQQLLREHDKLKLFELHPTDARAWRATSPSWKRAARWPCCAKTGLRV